MRGMVAIPAAGRSGAPIRDGPSSGPGCDPEGTPLAIPRLRVMRITVIGCGYLGATHAAAMADLGHEVLGMEIDPAKRAALARGRAPMYEPGLDDLLARGVGEGRLRFTDSYAEVAAFGDLHFLCVGTPQQGESLAADVSQVEAAIGGLAPHLDRPCLVVGKSTVPVGTAERMAERLAALAPAGRGALLAWNPEFLREGYAVSDTLRPDRIVVGVAEGRAEEILRDFYAPMVDLGSPFVATDFATAELVKVAANSFLATKISFINAMAEVCEATGADVVDLADAIGYDARIGRRFLNAGIGFGGGCLPKDIRAFLHRAGELGIEDVMGFLRQVDDLNQRQRQRVVDVATAMVGGTLAGCRVAVWGASFKPDSDDVRDSPALWVAGQLHLRGAGVRVHDPRANDSARRAFPPLEYADSPVDACRDADLVLHLTEWPEFREISPGDLDGVVRRRQLFDGRNVLDLAAWRAAGWTARGVGRRPGLPAESGVSCPAAAP
jgi:UDPglucose 6-dehydrogenase